jgi:hypothetical protein
MPLVAIETPPWAAEAATPVTMRARAMGISVQRNAARAWPSSTEILLVSGCAATSPICMKSARVSS